MKMPRCFVERIVYLFVGLCLGLSLVGAAQADTAIYQILLDTDHNPATGCTVATVKGPFIGADQQLVTTVIIDTNSATISGIQMQACTNGAFGAAVWSDAGSWPVGLGNGSGGAAVIETFVPLSALNGSGPLRLGVISTADQVHDALLAINSQSTSGIQLPLPNGLEPLNPSAIPVLHPLILALLVALLGGALRYGRRWPKATQVLVFVVALVGAGLAWAAFVHDGQTSDWTGVPPLATQSSTVTGPAQLVALFGNVDGANVNFRIDVGIALNQAPQVNAGADQTITLPVSANLAGTITDDGLPNPPDAVTVTWSKDSGPGTVAFGNAHAASTTATFGADGVYVLRLTANDGALPASDTVQVTVNPAGGGGGNLPPDPSTVAPPVDPTVATTTYAATQFLYTGNNPIQTGVAPGMIDPKRTAVLRGRVLDKQNNPLSGVTLTVLNHPEFGQTLSRADGWFDIAVNGGGYLTLNYQKAGYLPAQRQINVPWQDYVIVPEAILIPQDSQVTTVDLTASVPMQVARGSVQTDADGARQATLLFPQGTQATMVLANGSTQPLTNLHVRATEYTVGSNGLRAMPAELPPTSAYTYAVDLSVDEAQAASAKEVVFSQPVLSYVENFLNFPVGMAVPAGYYDRIKGAWIPSDNGRVIKVLAINGGLADLDTDGDNAADDAAKLAALGITDAERAQLANLYTVGQSLWRVPVEHFSWWDYNWPVKFPDDAESPNPSPSKTSKPKNKPDCGSGSIIECQNQVLRETVGVTGTPFSLNYASDRTPGRRAAYTLSIPLSGATVPASLKRIDLEVFVVGKKFAQSFPAAPNQQTTFAWDGLDAYGRTMQGQQSARVRIGYSYDGVYAYPAEFEQSFARFSGVPISGNFARGEVTLWQEQKIFIGAWDARNESLGGWTLTMQHAYDPLGHVLYKGDGSRRGADNLNTIINTVAGNGDWGYGGDGGSATNAQLGSPGDIAFGPDGSLYIADTGNQRVRRVGLDGIITTVAGSEGGGFGGDGGPATAALFSSPNQIAFGSDGSLYIADGNNARIRRVGSDGIISTVAGNGERSFFGHTNGDGGPATDAAIGSVFDLAVGPDGSLYLLTGMIDPNSSPWNHEAVIRRVGPDGIINTVAGALYHSAAGACSDGDGGPATVADLHTYVNGMNLGADGSIYLGSSYRIRRIGLDGIITTVVGGCSGGYQGDGESSAGALFGVISGIAVAPNGNIYIGDWGNARIRRFGPGDTVSTIAGTGTVGDSGDGGPATAAQVWAPRAMVVGPDGNLYVTDDGNNRIRRIGSIYPGFSGTDIAIASEDGSALYQFDYNGRHLRTLNALTGATLYSFAYDGANRLTTITDGDGDITTIERDGSGNALAIVGPFGQRTALSRDANGYLASVTNPAGESYQMQYTADGLLTRFTDPKGQASTMSYDAQGYLLADANAAGGSQSLARTEFDGGHTVSMTSALGRTTSYRLETLTTNDERRVNTFPDGTQSVELIGTNGGTQTTLPDGTVTDVLETGDPRFSMQAPITQSATTTTGGLTATLTAQRTVNLSDPNNLLSLTSQTDTVTLNGRTATSVYTAASRTATATSPMNRQSRVVTDLLGRPTQAQVGNLLPVATSYDSHGRPSSTTQGSGADARTVGFSYNGDGYLDTVTDPLGRTMSYVYDAAGRVTTQILPDGRQIRYGYDAKGNLTSLTPPGRPAHVFSYTAVDLTERYTPPTVVGVGDPSTTYSYNADKQLTQVNRPDGLTVGLAYDSAGRLSAQTTPDGAYSYAYNGAGQLSGVTAPDGGALAYSYSGSLLTQTAWSGTVAGSVSRTYDNDFRLASISVNDADSISYGYDNDSLLTQAGSLTLSRRADDGLLAGTTLGNVSDTQNYNSFGEVTDYSATANGTARLAVQYTRDKLGRITQKVETVLGVATTYGYSYDTAGRLVGVTQTGASPVSYGYDANGNRLSKTVGGVTVNGTYDDQDRLTQYGATTYAYTANGELRSKTAGGQTTTYQYDVLGNLRHAVLPDGRTLDYVIDGNNRRVGKKVNNALERGFLYQDGLKPIAELDGNNQVVSRFVYATGVNVPDYMVREGVTYRILTDHLGSPRLVVNVTDGSVIQRMDYDEFGNVTNDTNPGFQPFGFAGGLYDRDTRLVRFGARDYDAEIGRWTAKDPILFNGLNLFEYAKNNATNFLDPEGLKDNWYGYNDKNFRDYVHKIKQEEGRSGAQNYSKEELKELWEQWNGEGQTRGKGGKSSRGGKIKGSTKLPSVIPIDPILELQDLFKLFDGSLDKEIEEECNKSGYIMTTIGPIPCTNTCFRA